MKLPINPEDFVRIAQGIRLPSLGRVYIPKFRIGSFNKI